MPSPIDYPTWMQQPRIFAERCRGLPLIWTPDAHWFNNDWLGPTPHVHDDATEIAYLAQGQLEIEIGGSKRVYKAGDFIIMPPNKYHNYWFRGDEPVCFFVVVAPNHKYRRLRTVDFTPDNFEGDAPYANVFDDAPMPSNEHFAVEKLTLAPGESEALHAIEQRERVVYVVSGTAQIHFHTLSGPLAANQYLHIPAFTRHSVGSVGFEPLVYLSMIITDPETAHGSLEKED
jgi:mannose-6-phosphate isomerase-like protein (cupin superfamily)